MVTAWKHADIDAHLVPADLRHPVQERILTVLDTAAMSLTELARRIGTHEVIVALHLQRLADDGLIEASRSPLCEVDKNPWVLSQALLLRRLMDDEPH